LFLQSRQTYMAARSIFAIQGSTLVEEAEKYIWGGGVEEVFSRNCVNSVGCRQGQGQVHT
jgi:hypothetical protein